jgi:BASS family bile acid:Na+ symporter
LRSDLGDLDSLSIVLDPIGQVGVAAALMLVMFGVALGLRVADFRFLLRTPEIFVTGVALQVLALPIVTFGLVHLLSPPPSIALGMIVIACCPGGAVSNLLTLFARGDVAVSVALTATSSLMAALVTPAATIFWSRAYAPTASLLETLDVNPWLFIAETTLLLAASLVAGLAVAAKAPVFAAQIRKKVTLVGGRYDYLRYCLFLSGAMAGDYASRWHRFGAQCGRVRYRRHCRLALVAGHCGAASAGV